ncbi:hypothetical protein [Actinomadura sp. 3N407]|uniref:hypothetical protein n=1 Tax=Actinomadura sp. 3N407 TaxID=3457423 RepID=UPI003FCE88A0
MSDMIASRSPLTIKAANVHLRHIVALSAVLGGIGVVILVPAITGDTDDPAGAIVIAAAFIVLAYAPPLMWRTSSRQRRLVLDADGIRMSGRDGRPWAVTWPELGKVTFSYTRPDTSQPSRRQPARPPRIELVLSPAAPDFRDAHPEMEHLAEEAPGEPGVTYSLPLGNAQRFVGPIDDALTAFAPGIYVRDGRDVPRGLRRPWVVVVAVVLVSAFWIPAMGYATFRSSGGGDAADVAMGSFWTAIMVAWLVRVWAGGPLAVGSLGWIARFLGPVFLIVMAWYGMNLSNGDGEGADLLRPAAGVLFGAGLLVTGLLLKRADVREWCEARAQGR